MAGFLAKLFGGGNDRVVKFLQPLVDAVNAREQDFEKLTDDELRGVTEKFKARVRAGEALDDLLPEAFAAVREAAKRTLGLRHFDVQLIGGMVLHQGKITEMKTGEGKTLVATLPLYLNALIGKGAHLVTPNDYLSRVGAGWMGPVYHALGMSVAVIAHDHSTVYDPAFTDTQQHGDNRLNHFRPVSRHDAYMADITYGTNNEFGFDYLRDNLEQSPEQLRQRDYHFAIVDEVDSILIDEARTPLIISVPDEESADLYKVFSRITPQLKVDTDYNIDEKMKAVSMTEGGIERVEKILNLTNIYEEKGMRFVRYLESALRAKALFQKDRDYVVRDGQVIIVDEFTGRLMPGRRWSDGLHQAIEAKEGVQVQKESRTLATVTFQNYFRMYEKLAGMTGTAQTSAEEFHKVYNLDVVTIPTHRNVVRKDMPDQIFRTEKGKFTAVVREIKKRHAQGQPVLIGTISIEKSERLAKMLQVEGIQHEVLNAKNHEREALIIAQAGQKNAVTVSTNMAGRGVDIILGDGVQNVGGLHVIGTERHEARRIDNQLRGRAGRQGDPGSSQFFVSMEDDLMRVFGSDKIKRMMETLGIPEDEPIENSIVSRALESAQAKIEGFHFDSRKHVLEYDDVLNKQRDAIYRMRREVLFNKEPIVLKEKIQAMLEEEVARVVEFHTQSSDEKEWDTKEIAEVIKAMANVDGIESDLKNISDRGQIVSYIVEKVRQQYDAQEKTTGEEQMRAVERAVLLRSIDTLWMDHLDQMEHLRDSVRLRAYGQRDPLVEYKKEGSQLFQELQIAIRTQVANSILKAGLAQAHTHTPQPIVPKIISADSKNPTINRNDPCPCGSGKKYKKCHGV